MKKKPRQPFSQTLMGAVALGVLSGPIVWALTRSTSESEGTGQPRNAVPPPPLPYVERETSPFEGALYGQDWSAIAPFDVYAEPSRGSVRLAHVEVGDTVHDEIGQVHTTQYGVYQVKEQALLPCLAPGVGVEVPIESGDTIYQLNYYGEGDAMFWVNGRYCRSSQASLFRVAALIQPLEREWWVRVRLRSDLSGWMVEPYAKGKEAVH